MLKHILGLSVLAFTLASAAFAQSASEIAIVQSGHSCSGCNLFQAELDYSDLSGLNLSGSRLRQADMAVTLMDNANLSGANLSIANLYGARLSGANCTGTNFEDAVLVGTYLGGVNFTGANLKNANLSGAEAATAKGLTQSQLNTACGDASTQLPAGFTLRKCK